MTRDDRRSHGANAPPDPEKPNVVTRARRAAGAKAPPARAAWRKPLDSYDRHERREFQVARFG
jgi:hypothetical protein